ncbi:MULTISPECIES: ABC transporter permease [unclassified Saccharibacter]|uniref:MlaE family ABC transporter permease n=1 Tax=unclassified Saccharibacter TaxID=2648722 RepID=UPI00132A0AE9|nr:MULTISPECIES: ABC transporter permease [unclassified Saccharibacter]MXV35323.1 ABC transporter permease [Saccharibacter sp. EH611]MXV57829.1 ABC transporter permease [Saccharibacter sp. EH70]MXV65257.1 ABC transporter permease [Saccharibacter sp. EH60]
MNISERFLIIHRITGFVGRVTRAQPRFMLIMIGAGWGILKEIFLPSTWRRTVKIEFWKTLRQVTAGGLLSVIVVASITGFGIVAQAVFWLGFAGMAQMTGGILASVLVREIAPVLVGVILLGRSGMLMLAEMGNLATQGQLKTLTSLGIDPFLSFVLPRTVAMTISGFTLGTLFSLIALGTGYVVCWAKGIVTVSLWSFMFQVVNSVNPLDYIGIPIKFLLSGSVVGLCCCLSGMDITSEDNLTTLLPRGFSRGMLSVLAINVVVDLVLGSV